MAREPVDAADRAQGVAHQRDRACARADDRHLLGRAGAAAGRRRARDQVGTKDFEFDVSADAARQIQAQIDGADGDDYDLYLYKGTKSADNVVASSTSETADETIAYDYPQPGHYILSVQNWLATGGWTGTLKVFGSVPGSEVIVPAGIEAWSVTCDKPNGKRAGSEQVVIDRGQRKTITACRGGGRQPR